MFKIFLILTLVIYVALPSLRNLPGKIVLSNVIAVTATTVVLIISYNVVKDSKNVGTRPPVGNLMKIGESSCIVLGHFVYYFGISMFCWMTIMCYDLSTIFVKGGAMPHISRMASLHQYWKDNLLHKWLRIVFPN